MHPNKHLIAADLRVKAQQGGAVGCDECVSFHAKNFRPQPTFNHRQV